MMSGCELFTPSTKTANNKKIEVGSFFVVGILPLKEEGILPPDCLQIQATTSALGISSLPACPANLDLRIPTIM